MTVLLAGSADARLPRGLANRGGNPNSFPNAPARLAALLAAAAAYAAGGRLALERKAAEGANEARLLLSQMR